MMIVPKPFILYSNSSTLLFLKMIFLLIKNIIFVPDDFYFWYFYILFWMKFLATCNSILFVNITLGYWESDGVLNHVLRSTSIVSRILHHGVADGQLDHGRVGGCNPERVRVGSKDRCGHCYTPSIIKDEPFCQHPESTNNIFLKIVCTILNDWQNPRRYG